MPAAVLSEAGDIAEPESPERYEKFVRASGRRVTEAFENRKALAKKMGEECESKLLLPMILMLLTILVMIMYPAVVSFQI